MDSDTYHSDRNLASILIAPHAALSLLATIFVCLRLYVSKYVTKTRWSTTEYTAIATLVASHALLIGEGVGQFPIAPFGLALIEAVIAVEVSYGFACPLSKMVVLAMYYRVFSTSPLIRYSTFIMTSLMAGWGIAVIIVSIFTCTPVRGYWDHPVPSKCIDSNKFYIGITIPNIIFDLVTVAFPIREVWRLQMGRDKKWALTSIFLMGGSVVFASIARLVLYLILKTSENITQTLLYGNLASSSEICLAIIAACMPPCSPLLKRILTKITTIISASKSKQDQGSNVTDDRNRLATLVTIGQNPSRGKNITAIHGDGSFERLDNSVSLQGSTDGLYDNGAGWADHEQSKWSKIHVRHEVAVETTTAQDIPMRNL
ncbi:hypothetical protein FPSE5266_05709 [Fusarium pseudograminearum]|nr:hypothetical protein FPSE5266_05709 [Fusarium pseudograminearum]